MEGSLEVILDVDTDSIVVRRKGVGRVKMLTVVRVDGGRSYFQASERLNCPVLMFPAQMATFCFRISTCFL